PPLEASATPRPTALVPLEPREASARLQTMDLEPLPLDLVASMLLLHLPLGAPTPPPSALAPQLPLAVPAPSQNPPAKVVPAFVVLSDVEQASSSLTRQRALKNKYNRITNNTYITTVPPYSSTVTSVKLAKANATRKPKSPLTSFLPSMVLGRRSIYL